MCLRFDDVSIWAQRKVNNKAAPISDIFEQFILYSKNVHSVSSDITND